MRNILSFLILLVVLGSCDDSTLSSPGVIYLDLGAKYEYARFETPGVKTNEIATLGRVLFYDRQLSINNTVACASCHKQEFSFSDNRRFSKGFEGKLTSRNSMPLQNLGSFNVFLMNFAAQGKSSDLMFPGFGNHFFWDGRENSLQNLILRPVGNHIEMGITNLNDLAKKLTALPYYQPLFQDAFGTDTINNARISEAVTAFISSIETNQTTFDTFNSKSVPMTALEMEGMNLFKTKYDCNSCHRVESPIGYQFAGTFANIGLDPEYNDSGVEQASKLQADGGKFKIPSLRNISYTAPYMHDGRFQTLDEVIEHYSEGINDHPNLDTRLKGPDGAARQMNISKHEKDAIIAFIRTLNDESILHDPKFSDPFKLK